MDQMEIVSLSDIQKEMKELRQSLDYWHGELKFKREADMAKIELKSKQKEFNEMWKSRSCYIEIIAIMLMELKNLFNVQETYPIINSFIRDGMVDRQKVMKVLNDDRPTKT